MKLHLKLTAIVAAGICFTIALLVALLLIASKYLIHGYTHVDLRGIGEEAEGLLAGRDKFAAAAIETELDSLVSRFPGVEMELLSDKGDILYASTGRTQPYDAMELAALFVDQPNHLFMGKDVYLIYEMNPPGERFLALLSVDGDATLNVQIYMFFRDATFFYFVAAPLLLILLLPSLFVALYIVRMNRRLQKLNIAMQQSDLEEPPVALEDASRDEIGQLTGRFNAMQGKLRTQFSRIQRMEEARISLVSNISHDLRTPLASIKGYAEALQRGNYAGKEDIVRFSTIVLQRSDYMDKLLTQLFRLSMLDQGSAAVATKPCNLSRLLQQIVIDYALLLEERGFNPEFSIPLRPVWAQVDEQAIEQAIRNVIDNAIGHGESGRYIGVALSEGMDTAVITVQDRGKGIPEAERERIFDRFYRIDKGRRSGGMGVGLAFAKEIVERHQGRMEVESEPFVRTVFTITLPRKPEDGSA